jgi:hypothetical protein
MSIAIMTISTLSLQRPKEPSRSTSQADDHGKPHSSLSTFLKILFSPVETKFN